MKRKAKLLGAIALVATLPGLLIAAPAQATEIERSGNCSMGSIFSAEIELEYNVWDINFEVNTREAGDTWRLIVNQNGKRVSKQRVQSFQDWDDSYSEVEWSLIRPHRAGDDRFFMSAKNLSTGEICKITLRG